MECVSDRSITRTWCSHCWHHSVGIAVAGRCGHCVEPDVAATFRDGDYGAAEFGDLGAVVAVDGVVEVGSQQKPMSWEQSSHRRSPTAYRGRHSMTPTSYLCSPALVSSFSSEFPLSSSPLV